MFGLPARVNASIRKLTDIGFLEVPPFDDRLDKLLIHIIDDRLEDLALIIPQRPGWITAILEGPALDHRGFDANFPQKVLGIGQLDDHPNAARDRPRIGEDPLDRSRHVVAAGGGQAAHGGHDGLSLRPRALDLLIDLLGSGNPSPRTIDAEHDGFDRRIVRILLELSDRAVGKLA